ncbi:MAG: hypothetical protein ABF242_07205 [Flavobacteriales bacterium]
MKNLSLILLFFAFVSNSFLAQTTERGTKQPAEIQLIFKPGKTRLTAKHKKILDKAEVDLSDGDEVWIYPLSTYKQKKTRSAVTNLRQKSERENVWFDPKSQEQAKSIIDYLVSTNNSKIEIDRDFGYLLKGPSIRVKISLNYYKEPIAFNGKREKPSVFSEQKTLKDLYPEKESQFFIINPNEDTLIEGNEGTKLFFAKGSLLSKDLVQIELKEFYKTSDFFKADLQTVSNGKLLYTGGTIYLDAREKANLKKQVKINPSRGINAEFTEGKNDPKMKLFLKDKNAKETNWLLSRKSSWRYTRNYMLNRQEKYKTLVFNSPNEYQVFFTSGEAKKVEDEWTGVLKAIYREKKRAEREKREAELARVRAIKDSIYREENKEYFAELADIKENDATISRLAVNNLGFINCDKFVDTITENFEIFADNSVKATYYIIFEKEKGIVKGRGNREKITFGSLPVDQSLTVIGISISNDKQLVYKKRLSSVKESVGKVSFTEASKVELDNLLAGLND